MKQLQQVLLSWRFWAVVIGVLNLHLPELEKGVDLVLGFKILAEILAGAGLIRTVDRLGDSLKKPV